MVTYYKKKHFHFLGSFWLKACIGQSLVSCSIIRMWSIIRPTFCEEFCWNFCDHSWLQAQKLANVSQSLSHFSQHIILSFPLTFINTCDDFFLK